MMDVVRFGVVGAGTMGLSHIKNLKQIENSKVVGIVDISAERLEQLKTIKLTDSEDSPPVMDSDIEVFTDYKKLIDKKNCDCIVVVTPHPAHLEIAEYAFSKGMHVMCDKPITVTVSEADRMIRAWKDSGKLFSTMFTMRTTPINIIVRDWVKNNKLGNIIRVEMTSTEWIRTQKYYDVQKWRGTWKGEGGGLLVNQAPHNLDLLYFWFGEASSVTAEVGCRFHTIDTEDEVDAKINMKDNFPVSFYANTGECPGKDYVEIVGTKGTLIREDGKLIFKELKSPLDKYIMESEELMKPIEYTEKEIDVYDAPRGHKVVFENIVDCIINDKGQNELIAPGDEAIQSVEWANAMLLSSFNGTQIELPVNRKEFDKLLEDLKFGKKSL
jgi:predicted dehydrogenase